MKYPIHAFQILIRHSVTLGLAALTFCLPTSGQARTFQAEGSDLLMGVGPAAIALGGAVTASTDDAYSMYWNPAGLAELHNSDITLSRQLNARLIKENFIGVAFVGDRLNFAGYKTALGFAWLPRLHVKAEGNYRGDEYESVFLRYALPGLPEDFNGEIESKTRDKRMVFAISPQDNPQWSLGLSLGRINCGTQFCGVFAKDPGNYTVASAGAKATTLGIGGKYHLSERLTLGLNVKDIHTRLHVTTIVTDKNGTTEKRFNTAFPRDITLGLLWRQSMTTDLTADIEELYGKYGNANLNFRLFRAGVERHRNTMDYRFGLVVPLSIKSSSADNIQQNMPFPFLLTTGFGWHGPHTTVDFALYPHPIMSYEQRRIYPAADLAVTVNW